MSEEQAANRESIRRVRIGMTGLGGIVLLLALVNIVVDNVRPDSASSPTVATGNAVAPNGDRPAEPLAELGVTPTAGKDGVVVPDLKPDPKLKKPMDQELSRTNGR